MARGFAAQEYAALGIAALEYAALGFAALGFAALGFAALGFAALEFVPGGLSFVVWFLVVWSLVVWSLGVSPAVAVASVSVRKFFAERQTLIRRRNGPGARAYLRLSVFIAFLIGVKILTFGNKQRAVIAGISPRIRTDGRGCLPDHVPIRGRPRVSFRISWFWAGYFGTDPTTLPPPKSAPRVVSPGTKSRSTCRVRKTLSCNDRAAGPNRSCCGGVPSRRGLSA